MSVPGASYVGLASVVLERPVMGVNRFEDLRVWQLAKSFSDDVGGHLHDEPLARDLPLRNQLSAASISTMANIAEGFAREGRKEFAQFVRIAAASNAEARSLLHAAYGRKYIKKADYERLVEMTESIGRMLRVLGSRLREP